MNDFEPETIRAAASIPDAAEGEERGFLTLSNGVRLRLRPVPPLLLNTVANKFKAPEVPKVFISDDDRYEENPSDPDYVRANLEYMVKLQRAMIDLLLLRGTELVFVPETFPQLEADGWIEDLETDAAILGIDLDIPRASKRERYLSWLRLCALAQGDDLVRVQGEVLKFTNLTEEEVAEAAETFRSVPERAANNGHSVAVWDRDGDQLSALDARSDY